jgi:membrane protease YdiL (CAAX protease family)
MQETLYSPNSWKRKIIDTLRRSAGLRGTLYLTAAAAALEGVYYIQDKSLPYNVIRLHMKTAPIVGALTCLGLYAQNKYPVSIRLKTVQKPLIQTIRGAGLGIGAYTTWLVVATNCGWMTFQGWGWDTASVHKTLRSAALLGVGHLAVAWNEEQVFRGYGFDSLRQALGGWGAVAILAPLFAISHGLSSSILQFVSFVIAGGILTLMRVESKSIWFGVGYHWMWNFMQTGLFGPATAEPSFRPIVVDGPYQWVGKPGSPEPGLLSTMIQCAVGIGIGLLWLAKRRRESRHR